MVQVLYPLEVFILAHYGPPSTETPTTETTIVRVIVKVADEGSTPLTSINSGTSYFSYNLDVVTSVVTWS